MANHFSALKAARQIQRRAEVNRARRTRLRHQIRAMRRALEKKDSAEAGGLLAPTMSLVDRAAKWGIIKKNTAARFKSRLTKRLKSLAA